MRVIHILGHTSSILGCMSDPHEVAHHPHWNTSHVHDESFIGSRMVTPLNFSYYHLLGYARLGKHPMWPSLVWMRLNIVLIRCGESLWMRCRLVWMRGIKVWTWGHIWPCARPASPPRLHMTSWKNNLHQGVTLNRWHVSPKRGQLQNFWPW